MKRNFCVPVLANHWYGYDHDCPIDPATLTREKFAQYARHLTLEPNPNQGTDSAHICASFVEFPKTPRVGLLTKVIRILILEPKNSHLKFWLASCLESFLRGSNLFHQMYIVYTGLFHFLIQEIVEEPETQGDSACVRQISYDLLGEIIKFNKAAFVVFNSIVTKKEQSILFATAVDNIVDSNVFFRGLCLSIEKFHAELKEETNAFVSKFVPPFIETCRLSLFTLNSQKELLRRMMSAVHVKNLCAENICCVNTSLIIFMIFHFKSELDDLLLSVRNHADIDGIKALNNFLDLLKFWAGYYSHKAKDAMSLEYSTNIKTATWRKFTHLLKKKIHYTLDQTSATQNQVLMRSS